MPDFPTGALVAASVAPRPALYGEFARPALHRLMRALGLDVIYERARGDWLEYTDANGSPRRALDLLGGYGANLFGHHHPALVAELRHALDAHLPIQAQASTRGWAGELAAELSRRIGASTGRSYIVTLANTGAEAIEAALKHAELERHEAAEEAARRFHRRIPTLLAEVATEQPAFMREVARELALPEGAASVEAGLLAIARANSAVRATPPVYFALERAFHGKTSSASQITYHPAYRHPFSRIGVTCEFLPCDDQAAWQRAIGRATVRLWDVKREGDRLVLIEAPWVNVSAILIEPIQGEGGIHPLGKAEAAFIRGLADTHDVPLIIDEIQSGMGRTGDFLASTACAVRGDYYVFGKSLGGGLTKIAALAIDHTRYRESFGLVHTSTFAEDDLSSRVALTSLAVLDAHDVPGRCRQLGEHLLAGLDALVLCHPTVLVAARGRGLMLGLEFRSQGANPSNAIRMLSDQGYLGYAIAGYLLHEEGIRVAPTLSATSTIRIEPSAFVAEAELDSFVDAIERLCTVIARANAYRLTRYLVGLATPGDATPIEDFASVAQPRREPPRCEKRVAFIGHFIDASDALLWEPSLARLPTNALKQYQLAAHRVLGPTIYDQIHVTSAIGETVHLSFIGINLTSKSIESAMRARDTGWIQALIDEAVAKARAAGCQVVGLGGYTSIISDNGRRLAERGLTITTGNSLTVAMGIEALRRGAAERGIALASSGLGVLGATGNIGSVYARMMAAEVPHLVLVGREVNPRLMRLAQRIYADAFESLESHTVPTGMAASMAETQAVKNLLALPAEQRPTRIGEYLFSCLNAEMGPLAPILVTEDLQKLKTCRLIVATTNSASPVLNPCHLHAESVVICDLAVPADVAPEVEHERPDVLVIRGGLVTVPNDPDFRVGGIPLPPGHAFACLSETLLLGLMGVREHFSYGPVQPAKVRQAKKWAEINGFTLGDYKTDRSF